MILAIITSLLACYTAKLWKESARGGRIAIRAARSASKNAEAALAQVNALKAAERAYVFAAVKIATRGLQTQDGSMRAEAHIRFFNYGKTPAAILCIRGYLTIETAIPQTLIGIEELRLPDAIAIASNDEYSPDDTERDFSLGEKQAVDDGRAKLYCVGKIDYMDILGEEHTTGFCWEMFGNIGIYNRFTPRGFGPTRGSALNYRT